MPTLNWLNRPAAEQTLAHVGMHEGTAYYLVYNGMLGDKRPEGGNVLTAINTILPHPGPKVVYSESVRLGKAHLKAAGITFKHIPYDVGARR
jgi:adenine-specific DNA-methyltransferase